MAERVNSYKSLFHPIAVLKQKVKGTFILWEIKGRYILTLWVHIYICVCVYKWRRRQGESHPLTKDTEVCSQGKAFSYTTVYVNKQMYAVVVDIYIK